jgi:tetratricopeptide (TPR) repeat protein
VFMKLHVPSADPALVAADGRALDLLKADDEESIQKALDSWRALEAKAPEYVPLKANQLVAHVFLTQNVRDEIRRLTSVYGQMDKERARLEEKKEPAEWREKANKLREEMAHIKAQVDPLQDEASRHDNEAGEFLKSAKALVEKLGPAGDHGAVFRASALYYASKGQETTDRLADFYRKSIDDRHVLHDDDRAFADLAIVGRYAQGRITGKDRDKAVAAGEAALKKDPKLNRAHLFLAKVYLANKEYEPAKAEIEKLIEANPSHKAAAKLRAEIIEAAKAP